MVVSWSDWGSHWGSRTRVEEEKLTSVIFFTKKCQHIQLRDAFICGRIRRICLEAEENIFDVAQVKRSWMVCQMRFNGWKSHTHKKKTNATKVQIESKCGQNSTLVGKIASSIEVAGHLQRPFAGPMIRKNTYFCRLEFSICLASQIFGTKTWVKCVTVDLKNSR